MAKTAGSKTEKLFVLVTITSARRDVVAQRARFLQIGDDNFLDRTARRSDDQFRLDRMAQSKQQLRMAQQTQLVAQRAPHLGDFDDLVEIGSENIVAARAQRDALQSGARRQPMGGQITLGFEQYQRRREREGFPIAGGARSMRDE